MLKFAAFAADKSEKKLWQSNFIKAKSNLLKITQQWALLQNKENPKKSDEKVRRTFRDLPQRLYREISQ